MTSYTVEPSGRGGWVMTGSDDHVYGYYATEAEALRFLAEAMSRPEPGDKVRVTPLGYSGWVQGEVARITGNGAVEVETHGGCYLFDPSDVEVYRKAED